MSQKLRPPDFFIIGAPKCGTTALSEYLRGHPDIFMSYPKEPHFLASDMPQFHAVHSLEEYLGLFAGRASTHLAAGEASVSYLHSSTAVKAIRKLNPNARIIIMLRHPIAFLISYHAHLLFDFTEDRASLEEAWSLQKQRAKGRLWPKHCRSPQALQYGEMVRFGKALDKVFKEFPHEQVHCILQDEFLQNPLDTYQKTLMFLNVKNDFRTSFPRLNEAKLHRSKGLGRLILAPPAPLRFSWRIVKQLAGIRIIRFPELLLRCNAKPAQKQVPDARFQQLVIDSLAPDIRHLEKLLGRELVNWHTTID